MTTLIIYYTPLIIFLFFNVCVIIFTVTAESIRIMFCLEERNWHSQLSSIFHLHIWLLNHFHVRLCHLIHLRILHLIYIWILHFLHLQVLHLSITCLAWNLHLKSKKSMLKIEQFTTIILLKLEINHSNRCLRWTILYEYLFQSKVHIVPKNEQYHCLNHVFNRRVKYSYSH